MLSRLQLTPIEGLLRGIYEQRIAARDASEVPVPQPVVEASEKDTLAIASQNMLVTQSVVDTSEKEASSIVEVTTAYEDYESDKDAMIGKSIELIITDIELTPGETIDIANGPATVIAVNDEGFMVVVTVDNKYAVKIIPIDDGNKRCQIGYYEFQVGSSLTQTKSPIFVKTYGYFQNVIPGFGMVTGVIQEYINGLTLDELVRTQQIDLVTILKSFQYVASQLKDIEMTHYDIHRENIMLTDPKDFTTIKLIDFG
jgi:hypothetical protein